ncbi:MAG: anti sigma factor C-terminal domain-containing protein [Alkalibacterium sp.]|nr:anti sigma factor C-terminal domain-containing protein [Alkalibacterium sp.]
MNFKDLLKRYEEGTATEEEIIIVQNELEKYESLETYFAEQLSDDFIGRDGSEGDSFNHSNETKDIQKVVNLRLAKVVATSVLMVIILYVSIFYGVSALVDQRYYDPTQISEYEDQEHPIPDFHFNMQAHISLNMPGYVMNGYTNQEPQGFGEYDLSYSLRNVYANNEQVHLLNLVRGSFTYGIDGIYGTDSRFNIFNGFEKIQNHSTEDLSEGGLEIREEMARQQTDITLDYLNGLNPLSYISMSIVFNEDLTMEELNNLSRENEELDFKWAGIRTTEPGTNWREDHYMHLIGFNPDYNDEPGGNMRPDPEKYPLFNLNEYFELTPSSVDVFPEAYETHFKSRLAYLRDQEEFVELVEASPSKVDFYNTALEYVEEKGVKTYGVRVYGTAEMFIESIENIPYDTIYINDVSSAKPSIY